MELEIECMWHTDETRLAWESGIDFDIDDCITKTITFYHIDLITPYEWNKKRGEEFCKILSGGEEWIVAYTYDQTKDLISHAIRKFKQNYSI